MKCAIYTRVSTEEQAKEGFSIRGQKERLDMFAQSQDWDIYDYYIDEGKSAKDIDRDELQRMLEDIANDKIEVVLVYKLDRLTRSVMDLYKLLEKFEANGCMFKSATEVFDTTTPTGRLFITLVAAVAQWERENLGERVKFGMEQMVEEGRWPGGPPPFGFRLNEEDKLIVDEEESGLYKYMYELYETFHGDFKISNILNHELQVKTRKGNDFSAKTVRDIMKNPIVYGAFKWSGKLYDNFAPAIVPKDRYDNVMELRNSRKNHHPQNVASDYIFTGVVKCARCGAPLKGALRDINGTKYRYVNCTNQREKKCDLPLIRESSIELYFLNEIQNQLKQFHEIAFEVGNEPDQATVKANSHINQLQKQLKTIKERKKKWQLAFANDVIDLQELREHTTSDRKRQEEIEAELIELVKDDPQNTSEEIVKALTDFLGNWDLLEPIEKKHSVMLFLKKFDIDCDNGKGINYKKRKLYLSNFQYI
ncbi:recombinase family protein [Alkalicoccobacillus porphyridii]|uniref:Recombinase family protein n=1 Tax=Alkalicoccobacillus porphyridii TaxID=2597270 RepID=A0A554A0I6_9BACI|nr:recombinase family protein [Alkalicoccobacillus porphyridii]TSB47156.1 recombinase family protein [Alkalicoccobacillus porphyridii]